MFWDPEGPFYASKHDVNKIIIASHSVSQTSNVERLSGFNGTAQSLQQDFLLLYFAKPSSRSALPWAMPQPLPGYTTNIKNTLYSQRYLSITIDEAHAFRNVGPKHLSVLALMNLGTIRFAMTATPLQTSTKVAICIYVSLKRDKADILSGCGQYGSNSWYSTLLK